MIIQAIVLIVTIVLAAVDTSSWPVAFFYITMACVVVLNMAAGIYQVRFLIVVLLISHNLYSCAEPVFRDGC